MRSFKKISVCVLFLAGCVLLNSLLNYSLIPYTYTRADAYHMRSADYQEVLVGSSHGKCGLDPQVLRQVTGLTSLNLCQGGEYPVDSYFLVKEAARHRKLQRVIVEVDPGYWVTEPNQTSDYLVFYQEMENSPVKAEYFLNKIMKADFRTALFPWYLYRKQITQIPQTWRLKKSSVYRQYETDLFCSPVQEYREDGMIYRKKMAEDKKTEDCPVLFDSRDLNPDAVKYFNKLAAFCRKEKISLVAVTTPIPRQTYEKYKTAYDQAGEYFSRYMKEHGVEYYDFTRGWEWGMPWDLKDFADYEGHLYGEAAAAFTESFARMLVNDKQECRKITFETSR